MERTSTPGDKANMLISPNVIPASYLPTIADSFFDADVKLVGRASPVPRYDCRIELRRGIIANVI